MNNLYRAWGLTFLIGVGLVVIDVIFLPVLEIRGIPAFSIIGVAFILLVFTSVLNWIFKEAWEQRNEVGSTDD